MSGPRLHVLQVSPADLGGGAERVARELHRQYQQVGHVSWLAVANQRLNESGTLEIPTAEGGTFGGRAWMEVERLLGRIERRVKGARAGAVLLRKFFTPRRVRDWWCGREDFNFPATRQLLALPPQRPDVVHCHNLHGEYFDLRVLSALSRQVPVVLTVHDEWLFTGHCAYTLGCERWRIGCGRCPSLSVYPAIRRDATAENWLAKKEIYTRAQLYVAAPSAWLLERVRQSVLARAIVESRVIANGVDCDLFTPGTRAEARDALGLPLDADVLIFVAYKARTNGFKDYATVRAAASAMRGEQPRRSRLLIVVGDAAPTEKEGDLEIRFVGLEQDPKVVAQYYQGADLCLHGANAENFPTVVLESLASGLPVVATAVGGIPEQIKSLAHPDLPAGVLHYGGAEATGLLVPEKDAGAMARAASRLLQDAPLRRQVSGNAVRDTKARFGLRGQSERYLDWYREILHRQRANDRAVDPES